MTRTCHDFDGLIDLYAAGELPPEAVEAARAHLRGCAACRRQLDEARLLLGLLDVHHASAGGLARLRRAVRREAGGRRVLRLAERLAPLAALLLVAAGLFLLMPARPAAPAEGPLFAELSLAKRGDALPVAPGKEREKARSAAKMELSREQVAVARAALEALPLGLLLTLYNPTDRPLVVELGGAGAALRVEVNGPVERVPAPPGGWRPLGPRRQVVIPPRGRHAVALERLAEQAGERAVYLYPSREARYDVTLRLTAPSWPRGEPGQRRARTWVAGPLALRPG